MALGLFGFEIRRRAEEEREEKQLQSFAPEVADDGAVVVAAGGAYGTYVDLEGSAKTEADLVSKYREMALHPEVEAAIDDIINEVIIDGEDQPSITVSLDDVDLPSSIKKKITAEFETILSLLDWTYMSYETFKRWYVDGRLYYHVMIDPDSPKDGIQELRYIDPRKIRKVREIKKTKDLSTTAQVVRNAAEYFIYNDKGFGAGPSGAYAGNQATGLKIAKDSIVHCTSGISDVRTQLVLSHLHKAIKPLNQLRTLEDAAVIYRISRAPERRIFYIDVGNLPKMKAEQYLRDMMVRHKNKIVYDASTGELRDDRKFMTMLEDFWLPRREGGRGTEITTLPGGQNLGEMTDVEYFQKKMYQSLNVPVSRLQPDTGMSLGRASEITRDEVKFHRFVERLRRRFNLLFIKILEKQLLLKSIITSEDWPEIASKIKFKYAHDNYFSELKDTEILNERINILNQLDPFVGKYFSKEWVKKHVLRQTDDDIQEMQEQMDGEAKQDQELLQQQQGSGDQEDLGSQVEDPDANAAPQRPAAGQ